MARPRTKQSANLTEDQLIYLAGMFEATIGLRGVGTNGAVGISNTEGWPQYMASTYGGNHRQFTTAKTEKTYWGWYVPINRRLELAKMIKEAGVSQTLTVEDWDVIVHKLEKAVNSDKGDLGG